MELQCDTGAGSFFALVLEPAAIASLLAFVVWLIRQGNKNDPPPE